MSVSISASTVSLGSGLVYYTALLRQFLADTMAEPGLGIGLPGPKAQAHHLRAHANPPTLLSLDPTGRCDKPSFCTKGPPHCKSTLWPGQCRVLTLDTYDTVLTILITNISDSIHTFTSSSLIILITAL